MFQNIKWLFFDVGSTLVDEASAYSRRFQEIASAAEVPYTLVYDTAVALYMENRKGDKETAARLGVPLPKWHSEEERLYPDAAACLEQLRKRYKIGIIANQVPGTAKRLEQHGVLQFIDLVIASAEEGVAKPDLRIFELALERSGCQPEEAVMIGDRIDNDIIPAKQLGMHTVWIRQGFGIYWSIFSEAERPDRIVENLTELCKIL